MAKFYTKEAIVAHKLLMLVDGGMHMVRLPNTSNLILVGIIFSRTRKAKKLAMISRNKQNKNPHTIKF
jgi:hypothetical protein